MNEFYESWRTFLSSFERILVFPTMHGLYETIFTEDGSEVHLEHTKQVTYLRYKITSGKQVTLDADNSWGKFVAPRPATLEAILSALQRMKRRDGFLTLMCDDCIVCAPTYECYVATAQFEEWLRHYEWQTWDELQDCIATTPNEDDLLFATKYAYHWIIATRNITRD